MTMIRVMTGWVVTCCLLSAAAQVSYGQTRPATVPAAAPQDVGISADKLAEVKSIVQAAVDAHRTTGAVVLVARRGKVVLCEPSGQMDREAARPMRPDTLFRIYSMTKPVTTVAALRLVEDGKLDLEAAVSTYLPELRGLRVHDAASGERVPAQREMTVRDLMRHTSGLTYGFFGNSPVDRLYKENELFGGTSADMVRKLGKLPLQDHPGTRFNYSVSTDVLGRLIEVVAKRPLDEFLREQIFHPLGMRDTNFFVHQDKIDRFATHYRSNGKGALEPSDPPAKSRYRSLPKFISGGGGLVSTAPDYFRFCQMLLNGGEFEGTRVLRRETVQQMITNQLPPEAMPVTLGGFPLPGHGFGLGLLLRLDAEGVPIEYSWSGMASTFFWVLPRAETVVVVLQQVEPLDIGLLVALRPVIEASIMD